MATDSKNQERFTKMADTIDVIDKIVEQSVMNVLNYKVRDLNGKDQSIFDLVRSVGGTFAEVPWYGFDGKQPPTGRRTTSLAVTAGWNDTIAAGLRADNVALKAQIAELQKALAAATGKKAPTTEVKEG